MPPSRRDIGDECLHTSLESGNAAHGGLADLHRKLVTDSDEAARFLDVAELEVGTDKRRSAVQRSTGLPSCEAGAGENC
jgi:hypothetical protein